MVIKCSVTHCLGEGVSENVKMFGVMLYYLWCGWIGRNPRAQRKWPCPMCIH